MKKQLAAAFAAFLFVLSVCGAAFCTAAHIDHRCTGPDCAVCAVIGQCEERLHTAVAAAAAVVLLAVLRRYVKSAAVPAVCEAAAATLIDLKVKLLD